MSNETTPRSSTASAANTLTFRTRIPVPAETLFSWHERPAAFERLLPPWTSIDLKEHEGIREGNRATMRVGVGPFSKKWVAEHEDYEEGEQFRDVQKKGPFRHWEHLHRFEPDGPDAAYLVDEIQYKPPFGPLGQMANARIQKRLQQQFAYRHRITRGDLTAHRRYGRGRTLRVAVSGASGLIGSHLTTYLRAGGHKVLRLVDARKEAESEDDAVYWNYDRREIETDKLENLDAVIHLAGESEAAFKWSEASKIEMYQRRVRSTSMMAQALAQLDDPPESFLCASAVAIYGDRGEKKLTEDSAPGEGGFLTAVCRDWEDAAQPAADAGIRTVPMRIGVVMARAGGALPLMLLPFQLGLGGRIGGRRQYVPWIALDDVLQGIYHLLVTNELSGPVNLVAPNPVTTGTFARTLANILHRPAFLSLPVPLAKFMLGDAAEEFVLKSARVYPKRLRESGYEFLYPNLEAALRHQLGYTTETELSQNQPEKVEA